MERLELLFWITLVILMITIVKYYWRIQLMYNSSILSLYTPDSFSVLPHKLEDHKKITNRGKSYALLQRVVIVTMLRDVESKLKEIKKRAELTGNLFKDYHILIVENDSKDRTRELLVAWTKENPRVTILGCGYNAQKCSLSLPKTDGHHVDRSRIEKMTFLRNIYLEEIKRNFADWDYCIIWDLDAIASVYLDGITNSFGYFMNDPSIDVMCAYGIYRWLFFTLYYDSYAQIDREDSFHIDLKSIHDLKKGVFEHRYSRGEEPIEVVSCFSGFSIYRISALIPSSVFYDMSPPDNLECEHVRLHSKIKGRKMINPSMINLVLLND